MSELVLRASGVVCDDRPAVRHMIGMLLKRCGIEPAGEADGFVELLTLVLRARPTVAVMTLPLRGTNGVAGVLALRAAAPTCRLVVVSAFASLEQTVREAGAYAVLVEDDARSMAAVLRRLAAEDQRGECV